MRLLLAALAAASASAVALRDGLVDNPIATGIAPQYLDGEGWTLSNSNGSIVVGASVPGDIITDLEAASVVGDPLYERTWKNAIWDLENWTYTLTFDLSADFAPAGGLSAVLLVFDGIKMGAHVTLNGAYQGMANDQFLRYIYALAPSLLTARGNVLSVTFVPSSDEINAADRFMSCSGGWDWAPYAAGYQKTSTGSTTFSKGMWKSVYLAAVPTGGAAITHVVPLTYYNGAYPSLPLTDATHAGFTLKVRAHMWAPATVTGSVVVAGSWGGNSNPTPVSLPAGESNATISLVAGPGSVKLWWPNGLPGLLQNLYSVSATFTSAAPAAPPAAAQRSLGFRVFTLVTGNDTDPSTLAGKDGSGFFTMRFKVNGANLWSRGGNMIPMEEMEGRMSGEAHRQLVRSAVDAGMNTFRLWGGGMYLPPAWYDACDEYGMLIYHDQMFAQGNHGPHGSDIEAAEIRHVVRGLSHHPSVAIWDGCNECNGGGLYASFVMTTVAEEDTSRAIWPSCPSGGWRSGVDTLWGLPNGNPLSASVSEERGTLGARITGKKTRAGAGAALPALSAVAAAPRGAGTCTFVPGIDLDQGTMGPLPAPQVADEQACCDTCAANPQCYAAVFAGNQCWMKNQTQSMLPVANDGVTACVQAGKPLPPLPPPTPPKYSTETHGPYQHGEGFPTVNSGGSLGLFGANLPPGLGPSVATGPSWWGTYASEFGGSVFSSFESMAPTLAPAHWGLHADPMYERNYAGDNYIVVYFNTSVDRLAMGEMAFKAQLYQTVMGEALEMKSDITHRRSTNNFGNIVWQYNEIWPTGGWGSVEYGTIGHTPGQVVGGRWKPLHYFYSRFLYRNQGVGCGNQGRCFVRNDDPINGFTGTFQTSLLHIADGSVTALGPAFPVSLGPGAAAMDWTCLGGPANGDPYAQNCTAWSTVVAGAGCRADGSDCVLLQQLMDGSGAVAVDSWELLTTPAQMAIDASARITATVSSGVHPKPGGGWGESATVTVKSDKTAVLVELHTLAQGRFSDNAFHVPAGKSVDVEFIFFSAPDLGMLTSTLRVDAANTYANGFGRK